MREVFRIKSFRLLFVRNLVSEIRNSLYVKKQELALKDEETAQVST